MRLFGDIWYKIKVNYVSGISQEFWVKSFKIDGEIYTWQSVSSINKPIEIRADAIESVWQVGYDKPLFNMEK
jgi:hypothetical protein